MTLWRCGLGAVLLCLVATPGAGQSTGDAQAAVAPGSEYEISVLTAGVGAEVWERWGHNMIRVRNTATGEDLAYNWGMFSFSQEGFVRRFLMGRMHYWMAADGSIATARLYRARDRTMIEQHLTLSPAERRSLVEFLIWNAREENRYYRYDYYLDNCSTRLRDALDRTLGGALRAATDTVPAGTTFRRETRRLSSADFLLYTGLMLGLGPATDRPISQWEAMFLPVRTMEQLRLITVAGPDGTPVPLVASEDTLYASSRFTEPTEPARRVPLYLAIGSAIGALLLGLGWGEQRKAFLLVAGLVALLLGLGGSLLAFLMLVTDHAVTYGNLNVLLVDPAALLLAFTLGPALAGSRWARRPAFVWAGTVGVLAVSALLTGVFSAAGQDLRETTALFLPIDLGLALGSWFAIGGVRWRPPRG